MTCPAGSGTSADSESGLTGFLGPWRKFLDGLSDPVVVLHIDLTVAYLNPAFEKRFQRSLADLDHLSIADAMGVAADAVAATLNAALQSSAGQGVKAHWPAGAGGGIKAVFDAVRLEDPAGRAAGLAVILRSFSGRPPADLDRQVLLRMTRAMQRYRQLDRLLRYVTRLIQVMLPVEGASVIFLDAVKQEFYFQVVSYEDNQAGRKFNTVRFPAAKGVAGEVYRTGKPLIVPDYARSPFAYQQVDEQTRYATRNMLDVPLRIKGRMIGVLCAVNKREGAFNADDIRVLSTIADVAALPIENARINAALQAAYERVNTLQQAKERVILHLSHELKTPLAVLSASLQLLARKLCGLQDDSWRATYGRAQRNLQRLVEMEYAVEDILRRQDSATFDRMARLPGPYHQPAEAAEAEPFFQQVNIEFLIHELKDPLGVIEVNARMLDAMLSRPEGTPRRQRKMLDRIFRGTKKVRALLEALLEVGRAEAVCFNCHPFEPLAVIRQLLIEVVESHAADLYARIRPLPDGEVQLKALSSHGVRVEAHPAVENLEMVQDETKFRQIVGNLLKNALFYRRRMALIHLTRHHDMMTVAVRDDGPGIADEHQEKIFERYTRVSPEPGVARQGHGLGLAVSRILARSMDGDITLESQLGQGAVFRLTLPLEFDPGVEADKPAF